MTLDLKSILQTMKKSYSFIIKIAGDIKENDFKNIDTILTLKGMTKRTKPTALPLAATPLDFPRLKEYFGTIYKLEMEFEYPITPNQIISELSTQLNLDRAFIIVRTAESPFEQYEDDYLKYKDEDYAVQLLNDQEKNDININDYYGDDYNKELIKKLQSKEAKKYQQEFKEVEKSKYNGIK